MCVRWYVAYPLSLRHLEEMAAERVIAVDHTPKEVPLGDSTVHRWAIKLLPVLGEGISPPQTTRQQKYDVDLRDMQPWLQAAKAKRPHRTISTAWNACMRSSICWKRRNVLSPPGASGFSMAEAKHE
jgi:transposase-like protein